MENLPEEVILEIFSRLPVKSLLRFKCLSMSWFSLISDPHFAELHFQRSSSQHSHRILYYTFGSQMQSIDINASLHDDSAVATLDFPLFKSLKEVDILGSCRGFMVLLCRKVQKLFLWNPATCVCKQIPLPRPNIDIFLYGFCYDDSTNDYLLLLALFRDLGLGFYVFSMRSNSWKNFVLINKLLNGNNNFYSLMSPERLGLMLNGAIHWLIWHLKKHRGGWEAQIIAFDIARKNLRKVPIPVNDNKCYQIGVLGGCLSLAENYENDEIKIWVMREYGVKSSWTKLISLPRTRISFSSPFKMGKPYVPLCFTKNGQLITEHGYEGLSKWSDKGELLELYQYCHKSSWGYATVYTETLLSLP